MKQTVGNACGTIGLLHGVGNVTSEIKLRKFGLNFHHLLMSNAFFDIHVRSLIHCNVSYL